MCIMYENIFNISFIHFSKNTFKFLWKKSRQGLGRAGLYQNVGHPAPTKVSPKWAISMSDIPPSKKNFLQPESQLKEIGSQASCPQSCRGIRALMLQWWPPKSRVWLGVSRTLAPGVFEGRNGGCPGPEGASAPQALSCRSKWGYVSAPTQPWK